MKKPHSKGKIITSGNLQGFFYDELNELNQKFAQPLSNEVIYYACLVMNRFHDSSVYFQTTEGKRREKILGTALLEAEKMERAEKKIHLKEIGDTALFLCGYFSDSLNRKIVNKSYYHRIGKTAYSQLDSLIPGFYEVPYFYSKLAEKFDTIIRILNIFKEGIDQQYAEANRLLLSLDS